MESARRSAYLFFAPNRSQKLGQMNGFEYFLAAGAPWCERRASCTLSGAPLKLPRKDESDAWIQDSRDPKLICIMGEIRLETNPLFCGLHALKPDNTTRDKSHSSRRSIRGGKSSFRGIRGSDFNRLVDENILE